jgi:predicted small integral membrane protein
MKKFFVALGVLVFYYGFAIISLKWAVMWGFNIDIGIASPIMFIIFINWVIGIYFLGRSNENNSLRRK